MSNLEQDPSGKGRESSRERMQLSSGVGNPPNSTKHFKWKSNSGPVRLPSLNSRIARDLVADSADAQAERHADQTAAGEVSSPPSLWSPAPVLTTATAAATSLALVSMQPPVQDEVKSNLEELRREIGRLKTENKELQFRLVFAPPGEADNPLTADVPSKVQANTTAEGELLDANQERLLKEEIGDLRRALQAQRAVCAHMKTHIDELNYIFQHGPVGYVDTKRPMPQSALVTMGATQTDNQQQEQRLPEQHNLPQVAVPLPAVYDPHEYRSASAKGKWIAQTVSEGEKLPLDIVTCHRAIDELRTQNKKKSYELLRLKTDLNDLLYSSKWTPEAYLMAKAYVQTTQPIDDNSRPKQAQATAVRSNELEQSNGRTRFPPLKNKPGQRQPLLPYAFPRTLSTSNDTSLPALKPRAPNPAGRHRSVQAVHKARHVRP